MPARIAYLPLETHPEPTSDAAIRAAVNFAAAIDHGLHVSTFAVKIPPVTSPLGGFLINIEGMARAAEDRSHAECQRLQELVAQAAGSKPAFQVISHPVDMGGASEVAVHEARHFDLTLVPWSADNGTASDLAQVLIFGAGTPVILVPATYAAAPLDHIALAWDESRAAARALGDALRLLAPGGRVTVLTVHGEKDLRKAELSHSLATALQARGYQAAALDLPLNGQAIADVLQQAAVTAGANLLAMGGFGHSRLRDFILGGATGGVLARVKLPVLLSH